MLPDFGIVYLRRGEVGRRSSPVTPVARRDAVRKSQTGFGSMDAIWRRSQARSQLLDGSLTGQGYG